MKLVMTLLARDEADVIDAQIAFHLAAGVDFVIATDNLSRDGTTEILERYADEGRLHLIREQGDDLRQSEWVTRMARLAEAEFGADWVINADADEFWLPRAPSFKDLLGAVPKHFGVIRGAWRNFVPVRDDGRFFAERMTVRLCTPGYQPDPLGTHTKSAHRATADVRIGRGNHEAFADGLVPLRGWFPIEILHFPLRSLEQCRRKYVAQFVALEKNAEKGIPPHMERAYHAYRQGQLAEFYGPLEVSEDYLERGLRDGLYVFDTRLRDALRGLGFGDSTDATIPRTGTALSFDRRDVADATSFAAEVAVLPESDLALALGERVDMLEAGVARLEPSSLARLRSAARRARNS